MVRSALEGIVPIDCIFGTELAYDESGEIKAVVHCPAGYGKVQILQQLQKQSNVPQNHIVYMGDGSSDIHVMLHVNHLGGLTIAVSENRLLQHVARRVALCDDLLGMTIPIFEELLGFNSRKIQELLEQHGFLIQEWEKLHADSLTILPQTAAAKVA
jgi:predicted HAD superfamily phosphohydrolase